MTRPFKSAAGMGQLSFACAHFELPHTGDLQNKRYTNIPLASREQMQADLSQQAAN